MAMDFSGRIGRVIDNPVEAQSAAMEEGHAWRVRDNHSFSVISMKGLFYCSVILSYQNMKHARFHELSTLINSV